MSYDAREQSIGLIEGGLPSAPDRLSRRRRFAPIAVDVDGDLAVTMFARRGVGGEVWGDNWTLARRREGWQLLGGGSRSGGHDLLRDRAAGLADGGLWMWTGCGATNRDARRVLPFPPPRFVRYAALRVAASVTAVDIAGRRRIVVPRHGTVCVVWGSGAAPALALLAADGDALVRISGMALAGRRSRRVPP